MKKLLSRILALLQPVEKRRGLGVSVSVFFCALLDFVGLAALLPILYYLIEDTGHRKAALIFCAIAMCVCLMKYIVSTKLLKDQNRYLLGLYKRLSFSLYSSYLHRGLLFIRKEGISKLGYEINAVCYAFSQSVLAPMLKMLGDTLLIVLVLTALLVYSPAIALILLLSFIPFAVVYLLVIRKRAKECGEIEQEAKRQQSRIVNDSFGGYADLQVNDAFRIYSRQFREGMDSIAESRLKMNTVQRLPLFLSEMAVVVGLTVLCLSGSGDISILIGVFALAAFRLLPAARSILSGWTVIQNAEYAVDIIEKGLSEDIEDVSETMEFNDRIEIRKLSYTYPDGENVLEDFTLTIKKGEYIGFRGDSGSGKSTLFNLLLGFIPASKGEILIDGRRLSADIRRSWLEKTGYVAQDVFIFNSSIADNIALGADVDEGRILGILDALNMSSWLAEQPDGLNTQLSERGTTMSGGQRQRIALARAIYRDVDVLLLDEASSSLDNDTERELLNTLDRMRRSRPSLTILSIAHRESSLVNCDRVVYLHTTSTM